jgi:basic membrane protein A
MPLAAIAAAAAITAATVAASAIGGTAARQAKLKVAMVTDIGKLQDKSFNEAANKGRLQAQKKLKIQTRVYQTTSEAERLPNLQAAVRDGYKLVIAVGFLNFAALDKAAGAFPSNKFAGVDIPQSVSGNHPNVRGLVFREEQAGYLAGYIAGLTVKYQRPKVPQVVSAVGANNVPAIVHYEAGYGAGAKKANPKVTVIRNYANDPTFSDEAKCKETALDQISRHTQVIFQVAGGCGLGAIDAANEHKIWGIGVDVNQNYLNKRMLTSAMKNVQGAVFETINEFEKNPSKFKAGFDKVFTVKTKTVDGPGVTYAPINKKAPKRALILKKVAKIAKLIAKGKIKIPTTFPGA